MVKSQLPSDHSKIVMGGHYQIRNTCIVTEAHFLKLKKLLDLDLSSNSFTLDVKSDRVLPFQVFSLAMSSCHLGPLSFPTWLKSQKQVYDVDFSNASISCSIPYWKYSIKHWKLCSSLCNNHLFGTIPTFLGQLSWLETLHLNDNKLYGQFPSSLQNLSSLETLNLGNNRLNGRIPPLIGKGFESLRILILRSNSFLGELPALLSNLSSLQVLDLAENQLTGSIPASFGHFKGQLQRYTKTLSLVTMLDLSGNNLSGDLPTEMTNLFGLVILNLSRNHFTGHIPKSISKLKQLSSLDLLDFRTKNTAKTKEKEA
ncbi:LRR receptor-like serine/threonine-protein kinase FLS2 [Ziziphus jujuba]|uniref:LRR receptor-like serine/threonine-protein kinase FLS2 n=1 Tax=Ziziphus jujuba TaxID=326968 RepID=A0ABM4A182_ZIZJJ|nr:LRR receptor-like serine/threonine-protein kinase FLS2 [Ziziphus jujuba]